jgi:predicted RNase H-like HicB family nuclease
MNKQIRKLNLIIIPDEKTGDFTAFITLFPNVMAVGSSEEEATTNLFDLLSVMMDRKSKDIEPLLSGHANYTQKQVELVVR